MATIGTAMVPAPMPQDARDPAQYCTWLAGIQQAVGGGDIPVPGPPVLWLVPPTHLRRGKGPLPAPVYTPLWWVAGEWREFPDCSHAPHAQAHAAYTPRRFEPMNKAGLLRVVSEPAEAGPEDGHQRPYGSRPVGVVSVLRMLLCERDGMLWGRPRMGAEWRRCPYRFEFQLALTEAFEVSGGDKYIFLFRSRASGVRCLDSVVLFDLRRNEWRLPVGPTRAAPGGHIGEPLVPWQRVEQAQPAAQPMRAWLLESSADYLVLLAPVSRDGVQRGVDDVHSAVHFFGFDGEVVSHHMACRAMRLSAQRYDKHILFAKDFDEHNENWNPDLQEDQLGTYLNNDWHHSYRQVAGWLLSAENVSVPPMPVHLPSPEEGWNSDASWSMVLARGNLEELAPSYALRLDTAPRIYLLEAGSHLRIWASRRVDDATDVLYQRHLLDGPDLVRHALSFSLMQQEVLEIDSNDDFGPWNLWSPDLRHLGHVGPDNIFGYYRCGIAFTGDPTDLRALHTRAYHAAAEAVSKVSAVDALCIGARWEGHELPAEDARNGAIALGLPCYPALRINEGTFHRTEDHWVHPIGRDPAQHVPLQLL
eukprot:gnl/TRDRNA2_/TRDRNA2_94501_c0_seq1.p1 gnl/TRDRNA2_/TRDRNA2_94501_c0~~gnl/TRDRNA2_/TRDRNA2_94501_c0_seq1.p1  ORF type:complete len:620 (+),score=81.02 gnl/TRDRNA2_/TRDRNA2_94501_c0_seq1:96-1862(+)